VATVHVGDSRVRALSEIFQPKKTTFAEFKVREVAWPEATGRKGEMEKYLDALGGGQVYVHVLRDFDSPCWVSPRVPQTILGNSTRVPVVRPHPHRAGLRARQESAHTDARQEGARENARRYSDRDASARSPVRRNRSELHRDINSSR